MAYCWLSRLHHARPSGGSGNGPVLPTLGGELACTVQGLAERFRLAPSCSDERRGHRSIRRWPRLRRSLETRPQENSCNYIIEGYEKNGSIAGTTEGDRRRVYSVERQVLCNRGRDSHAPDAASGVPSKLQRTPKRTNPRFFRVSDLARNPQPPR